MIRRLGPRGLVVLVAFALAVGCGTGTPPAPLTQVQRFEQAASVQQKAERAIRFADAREVREKALAAIAAVQNR